MSSIVLTEYLPVEGSRLNKRDAEIIGPELRRLFQRGGATAEDIVEAASSPRSPLHPYIEWDTETAAQYYREDQARNLARSIVVRTVAEDGQEQTARPFYPVRIVTAPTPADADASETAQDSRHLKRYITVDSATTDDVEQVMHSFAKTLLSARRRYEAWRDVSPEFAARYNPVFAAMDEVGIGASRPETAIASDVAVLSA